MSHPFTGSHFVTEMPGSSVSPHLFFRAFERSVIGTVITDALQDDYPIIYVNPAFERLTGYAPAEVLGRNCRFLQGEDSEQSGLQEIRLAIAQEQDVTVTLRNYRKDATLFHNEVTLSPLHDETGRVTHFIGYQNDVTVREGAALQAAQAYRQGLSIFERITDGFVSLDHNLNFTYVSDAAARLSGRHPADLIGRNLLTVLPELIDSEVIQAVISARGAGTPLSAVSYVFDKWVDITAYPAEDGISVFTRDITQRHQIEEQLRSSEERFTRIFQACPIGIIISRVRDQHYIDANPEFFRQSGYTREEVIGRTPLELSIWADPLEFEKVGRLFQQHGEVHNHEAQFRLKSGLVADAVISIVPVVLGEQACVVTLVRDITLEKQARQRLESSEARYRQVAAELQRTLDLSLDLITSIDTMGHFVTMSAACRQILGYAPEELIGRSSLDFVYPDDRARTLQEGLSIVRNHRGTPIFQNRYLRKDGTVVWLEWAAVVLPDEALTYCVARDITQRRAAEEDQAFLAAIVQTSQDAVLGVRLDGAIRSWNAGAERLYGYSTVEAVGQPTTLIVPPELHAEEAVLLDRAGQGEWPSPFETVRVARDGRHIPVFMSVSPIFDAAGQVIGVSKIAQDISERKATQAEIQGLNRELEQQLRHLTGLREIDQMITSSQDLSLTLDRILNHVEQQLGADAVALLLLDQHTLSLEYVGTRGFTKPLQDSILRLGTGPAGQVALNRQPLSLPDLSAASLSPTWWAHLNQAGLMAYYGAPLLAKGKVLGVIEVMHREPFDPSRGWLETFGMLTGQAAIAIDNAHLFRDLEQRNLDLRLAYDETIEGWARALDLRDKETEGHSRRVTDMTVKLCRALALPAAALVEVRRGALLHDIGKMGIPDTVLLKPGKLTDDEWVLMKRHPEYAVRLLSPIKFLRPALDIPQYHHEKWDGSGYPLGLAGEAIPLTARAFAVVDVYDALTSDRPYRKAWSRERAIEHIQSGAGTHFDPAVVRLFVQLLEQRAP
ncbi:PAS domain S-box protein [Deinococcus alpinitundrae]|uniref:PAS domain S-box protein n=1 Tax=Deinococcus alpinitundrae TaxID=468913 RepID=UPI00137AFE62|nr:PAS domain S-box protein [Deinococcus alpinitundrae]